MGLRDKYKKDDTQKFQPLDLNEMNVSTIFKKCLSTNSTPKPGDYSSVIFGIAGGYEKNHQSVCFNIKNLKDNTDAVKYLFGQLQAIHQDTKRISPEDALKKYNGTTWTTNKGIVMELLYLGEATASITPFFASSNTAHLVGITPTLSPKDPNFAEWYKKYEADKKKSEGPTPDEK